MTVGKETITILFTLTNLYWLIFQIWTSHSLYCGYLGCSSLLHLIEIHFSATLTLGKELWSVFFWSSAARDQCATWRWMCIKPKYDFNEVNNMISEVELNLYQPLHHLIRIATQMNFYPKMLHGIYFYEPDFEWVSNAFKTVDRESEQVHHSCNTVDNIFQPTFWLSCNKMV